MNLENWGLSELGTDFPIENGRLIHVVFGTHTSQI